MSNNAAVSIWLPSELESKKQQSLGGNKSRVNQHLEESLAAVHDGQATSQIRDVDGVENALFPQICGACLCLLDHSVLYEFVFCGGSVCVAGYLGTEIIIYPLYLWSVINKF